MRFAARFALLSVLGLSGLACASLGRREPSAGFGSAVRGAASASGGEAGAYTGAVAGRNTGSTARGAILSAAVGGTVGAVIAHQMDQQAKELRLVIPSATVERIGEGIQITFASGLMYGSDSDTIRADAGLDLRTLAASLRKYPDTALLIVGHTDALGTTPHNRDLSLRRAAAAVRYLSDYGVVAGRAGASGRGELEPLGSNSSEAGRQMNRRIEVAIYANTAAHGGAR